MKRKEFLRSTLAFIGLALDEYKESTEWLHHWPLAKLGEMFLEVNRDRDNRPEPFTAYDVMPWLGQAPPPLNEQEMEIAKAQGIFNNMMGMPGAIFILEE